MGLIWILDTIAIPILINVICEWFKEKRNTNNGGNTNNMNFNNVTTVNNNINNINNFNENIIHVEIKLPNGKIIKHDDDVESLEKRLNEESQE